MAVTTVTGTILNRDRQTGAYSPAVAVDISVSDEQLVVKFTGLDALWAVSGGITVPFTEVVTARVVDATEARARLRWKVVGTGVSGAVKAGRFTVADEPGAQELWSTYRDPT